jgi:hypothetical protein
MTGTEPPLCLRDFPAVFLSYDEPWANRNWLDLKSKLPGATRVHGVKGLDACHKAAASAVPGDWVVTIDADTRISPALADASVPRHLLTGDFRLDWLSRNPVTGLWSGNGCVKLWPKVLISEMRTHEAAPEGELSLDHDIGAIRSGKSAQVTMPERAAVTDPALTAAHAFRAGLREMLFLRSLAERLARQQGRSGWRAHPGLARLIEVWCTVGRHALNGRWMIYGSRLGLSIPDIWPNWDMQQTNDHDALSRIWSEHVVPRFQRGRARPGNETSWNWQALEQDLRLLAAGIAERGGPDLVECDADKSRLLASEGILTPPVPPTQIDALGYRLMRASRSPEGDATARSILERAAALDHPAAHRNLGKLLQRGPGADAGAAAWHLGVAAAMGNQSARESLAEAKAAVDPHLARAPEPVLAADLPKVYLAKRGTAELRKALGQIDGPLCLVLDPGVSLAPGAARHVPNPDLVAEAKVLGYLSICAVTGLPRPRGVRLTSPARAMAEPDCTPIVTLPVVLGLLPAPENATLALRGGYADAGQGVPLTLATIGRDVPFGDHWVLGSLLARSGTALTADRARRLAKASPDALEDEIVMAAKTLQEATGHELPVWTADESRALKRLLVPAASRLCWQSSAQALAGLGPASKAGAAVFDATAKTVWGSPPAEA